MRIRSAYQLYRVFFDYKLASDGTRRAFGMAIADTQEVICRVLDTSSTEPIDEYPTSDYPRGLTIDFLENFRRLATRRSRNFFSDWGYIDAVVSLERGLFLLSRRRGLDIPCPFLIGPKRDEIVIPTFGPPTNMSGELGVLTTLCNLGTVKPGLPKSIRTMTYWDLRGGTELSIPKAMVVPADPGKVLAACSTLMAS